MSISTHREVTNDLEGLYNSVKDPAVRANIIRTAASSQPFALFSLLSRALKDRDSSVRFAAVEEIGIAGFKEFVTPLILLLQNDPDYMVRVAAAESLGMLADPVAVPALLNALKDRSALVRGWAATSLSQFPTAGVMEPLRGLLSTEKSHFVKVCALSSLILLGDKDRLPALITELRWRNYRVRCAAANALAEVADKTNVSQILDALTNVLRREKLESVRSSIRSTLQRIAKFDNRAQRILESA